MINNDALKKSQFIFHIEINDSGLFFDIDIPKICATHMFWGLWKEPEIKTYVCKTEKKHDMWKNSKKLLE